MEYMSRKKDQNGISYPRMTLIGILEFEKGTKLEYSDPNWNSWGWKARIGISPLFITNTGPPLGVYTCPHKEGYDVTLSLLVVYIYLPYHVHCLHSLPPPLQSILLTYCRCRHNLLGLSQNQWCEHQVSSVPYLAWWHCVKV